nr:MAG TPA: ubiquitin associated domain protein [Caudoviricetes sp.]
MNKKYKYNQRIISELCRKYNVEADTVRKSLRGDRQSETSENIKRDYHKALKTLNSVTDVVLKEIINQ